MRRAALTFAAALVLIPVRSFAQDSGVESNIPDAGFGNPRAQSAHPDQRGPTLQVYSRETIVDVTVTGSDGKPIRGLKPSDFTLLEDGKPVTLSSFTEHGGEQPATNAPDLPALPLPADTFTNVTTPAPANASLNVLLLDSMNTPMATQQIVVQRMLDFVERLPPGAQIAVFTLGYHLSIVQGFTSDRTLLRVALNSKKAMAQSAPLEDNSQDPANIDMPPCPAEIEHMGFRGQYTITALRALALYLQGIPGRKNLIWFGGAFPLADGCTVPPVSYDLTDDMKTATDLLARSHVAAFPIDSRGLQRPKPKRDLEHLAMESIAEQTGGVATYNSNNFAGAALQAIDSSSSYYTLTYVPPNDTLDTRFRSIKVIVDRSGVHLTYRDGYYALPPNTSLSGKKIDPLTHMEAAMQRGSLAPTQILFSTKITRSLATTPTLPAEDKPDAKLLHPPYRTYSISFSTDVHNIQFRQTPDGNYRATFEFAVALFNPDGDTILNSASKTVSPILPPAVYESMLESGAGAHLEIAAPASGDYFLRIAVHDLTSDQVGAIEVPTASVTQ